MKIKFQNCNFFFLLNEKGLSTNSQPGLHVIEQAPSCDVEVVLKKVKPGLSQVTSKTLRKNPKGIFGCGKPVKRFLLNKKLNAFDKPTVFLAEGSSIANS